MEEARALITAFRDLNETHDRKVAFFTSSLISLFGSTNMFNAFLTEIDAALVNRTISAADKKRAANLTHTYIPQVAGLNCIQDLDQETVTVPMLTGIRNDSAENRQQGARIILAALKQILKEVDKID